MGYEAEVEATIDGLRLRGRALLEEREIVFRPSTGKRGSALRVVLDGSANLSQEGGSLVVQRGTSEYRFALGAQAAKWLAKAVAPPSRLAKLGLRDGVRFAIRGLNDAAFDAELETAGLKRVTRLSKAVDVILFQAKTVDDLDQIEAFIEKTSPAVAIWVVWAKGRKELSETHVRKRALDLGLVDVKVARFSDLLSALKLVVRKKSR